MANKMRVTSLMMRGRWETRLIGGVYRSALAAAMSACRIRQQTSPTRQRWDDASECLRMETLAGAGHLVGPHSQRAKKRGKVAKYARMFWCGRRLSQLVLCQGPF